MISRGVAEVLGELMNIAIDALGFGSAISNQLHFRSDH